MGRFDLGIEKHRPPRRRRVGNRILMEHRLVWEAHLEACSALAILALAGWKDNKGVQSEISIARRLGRPVIFIAPEVTA